MLYITRCYTKIRINYSMNCEWKLTKAKMKNEKPMWWISWPRYEIWLQQNCKYRHKCIGHLMHFWRYKFGSVDGNRFAAYIHILALSKIIDTKESVENNWCDVDVVIIWAQWNGKHEATRGVFAYLPTASKVRPSLSQGILGLLIAPSASFDSAGVSSNCLVSSSTFKRLSFGSGSSGARSTYDRTRVHSLSSGIFEHVDVVDIFIVLSNSSRLLL